MSQTPNRHLEDDEPWIIDAGSSNIRILREVVDVRQFVRQKVPVEPVRQIALIDVECTGLDPLVDQIIDLAYIVIALDDADDIVGIVCAEQALCDPMMPIPPRVSLLTGLTDEIVANKAIDLDRVEWDLQAVDVFVAHNCAYDLSFVGQLLPFTQAAPWACSLSDFDWLRGAGLSAKALGHLLMEIGFYHDGHRAMADVVALLHILSYRLENGRTVLSCLLENAEQDTFRVEAVGAPHSSRFQLKARGYRWDPKTKLWWKEIAEAELEDEELWLARNVVPHGPSPRLTRITWRERHR